AEHLDSLGMEVLGKAGERQPGLLDSRGADLLVQSVLACDQVKPQVVIGVLKQPRNLDRRHRYLLDIAALTDGEVGHYMAPRVDGQVGRCEVVDTSRRSALPRADSSAVERRPYKANVTGSIPVPPIEVWGVSSVG